jgi:hypothetical protein
LLLRSRFIGGCNYSFEVVAPLNAAIHLSWPFKMRRLEERNSILFHILVKGIPADVVS